MQSNGLDERFNQTLQRMLVKAITGQKELWDEFVDSAVFAYNTFYHESTVETITLAPIIFLCCKLLYLNLFQ